jgi:hypothetical protein
MEPLSVSFVCKMGPLVNRHIASQGDLQLYVEQLTGYFATNLEGFADSRGGDVFLAVVVNRGEETASYKYTSGHFTEEARSGNKAAASAEEDEVRNTTAQTGEELDKAGT